MNASMLPFLLAVFYTLNCACADPPKTHDAVSEARALLAKFDFERNGSLSDEDGKLPDFKSDEAVKLFLDANLPHSGRSCLAAKTGASASGKGASFRSYSRIFIPDMIQGESDIRIVLYMRTDSYRQGDLKLRLLERPPSKASRWASIGKGSYFEMPVSKEWMRIETHAHISNDVEEVILFVFVDPFASYGCVWLDDISLETESFAQQ